MGLPSSRPWRPTTGFGLIARPRPSEPPHRAESIQSVTFAGTLAYVVSLNRHRRHLTPSQLAMVGNKARGLLRPAGQGKAEGTQGRPTRGKYGNLATVGFWYVPRCGRQGHGRQRQAGGPRPKGERAGRAGTRPGRGGMVGCSCCSTRHPVFCRLLSKCCGRRLPVRPAFIFRDAVQVRNQPKRGFAVRPTSPERPSTGRESVGARGRTQGQHRQPTARSWPRQTMDRSGTACLSSAGRVSCRHRIAPARIG